MFVPIAQEELPRGLRRACGDDPGWFCERVWDWTGNGDLAEIADWVLGKPLTILLIIAVAALVNRLVRRGIKRGLRRLTAGGVQERLGAVRRLTPSALLETEEVSLRAAQRVEALAMVLRSVASFIVWLVAAFLILDELGVNLGPLLAGAGIVGVALGFGSQTLVRDFLAGIFILVEDQFGVGDIVDVGEASGVVEAVSLRTTRLRSVDGTVWHVPNGEIRRVGNMSQHWSRALLDIEVAYSTDIEHAKQVIKRVADAVWKERREVLEEPEIWGVENLARSGIVIRLVVKTRPSEQWDVSRELRQRIKTAFDEEGIEIPFPQQTVWFRPGDGRAGPGDGGRRGEPQPSAEPDERA